ncbi:iron-sulfur cluster assembly protein [Marinobacteraceae bacterium S3BR75-40.1]
MNINAEVTPAARDYLAGLLAKQQEPGMAARVFVENGGTRRAETCLAYCPPGQEEPSDLQVHFGELRVFFDAESVPYLQDMTIDLSGPPDRQQLTIKAPNSKKPAKPPRTFVLPEACVALRVPQGNPETLPEGATVSITQALGGSFTVNCQGNLYRLSADVASRLGLRSDVLYFEPPEDGRISEDHCWAALRQVYDPEIPVNVVSLGLVYTLAIDQERQRVRVEMTLTSPGCGMGDVIAEDVRQNLLQVPFVEDSQVEIVFDPPWSYDSLDEAARLELGLI